MSISTYCFSEISNAEYYYVTNTDSPSLSIPLHGTVKIGNDFTISGAELVACLKVLRKLAVKENPEDFL